MAGISDYTYDNGMEGNSSGNVTDEGYIPEPAPWMIYFVGTFLLVVCILGTLGNSTVLYVILRFSKMKTVTNCYIFNLALADEIFMLALLFMSLSTYMKWEWKFGQPMCHIIYAIDGFNQFVGVFCLTAMSFDRYVAVCHALKSRVFRNLPVAISVNVSVWFIGVIASIPILRNTKYNVDELSGHSYCGLSLPPSRRVFFIMYFFLVGFIIPLIIIVVCYARILIRLKEMGKKTGTKKSEKSRKVNRMVLIVVIVFISCWAPFYIWRIILSFSHTVRNLPDISVVIQDITMCISYMNSCANPFLYAFLSDNFKKSFRKAWTCGKKNQNFGFPEKGGKHKVGKSNNNTKFNRLPNDIDDCTQTNQFQMTSVTQAGFTSEAPTAMTADDAGTICTQTKA